jgi:hypothetical protein
VQAFTLSLKAQKHMQEYRVCLCVGGRKQERTSPSSSQHHRAHQRPPPSPPPLCLAAGFNLDDVRKLATQTKAIGVILPPPDIRAIVDKTAQFVAKHGELGRFLHQQSLPQASMHASPSVPSPTKCFFTPVCRS